MASNTFAVSWTSTGLVILLPPTSSRVLSKAEALNLAAWLAVLAMPKAGELEALVSEVEGS